MIPNVDAVEKLRRCLVFQIGASRFGLDARDALQVIRDARVESVPGGSPVVAGAMAFRQEIFVIVKIGSVLGVNSTGDSWVILLRHEERRIGLLVSDVLRTGKFTSRTGSENESLGALTWDARTDVELLPFLDVTELLNRL